MPFEVRENPRAVWTTEALEHIEKYEDEYRTGFTSEQIADQREKIAKGMPDPQNWKGRVFEIFNDGVHIGNVVVIPRGEGVGEVDTAIFDAHQGHGYGKRAVAEVLSRIVPDSYQLIQGRITGTNHEPERVRRLLKNCGFHPPGSLGGPLEIWNYP